MIVRPLLFMVALATVSAGQAQWDVPVHVELTGTAMEDRRVTGLADPNALDAGVSLDAARAGTMGFAPATGALALSADLVPAPLAYSVGMLVTVVPVSANAPGATLELNGLGPQAIVKGSGLPLDSADLVPGAPARLLYDGERFMLLTSALKACRTGYSPASATLCVEDSARAAQTFLNANLACAASGARLCKFGEWISACQKYPGFMGTVPEAEWVDSAGNHLSNAKLVGVGSDGLSLDGAGCNFGYHADPILVNRFRCCTNR